MRLGSRADLARTLQTSNQESSVVVLDDFTHNLDRRTAICVSACLSKQIRRLAMGCVVATSHHDLIPYMQPDIIIKLDWNNRKGEERVLCRVFE